MAAREPITEFDTHAVTNQPPPLEQYNAFVADTALREAVEREDLTLHGIWNDIGEGRLYALSPEREYLPV